MAIAFLHDQTVDTGDVKIANARLTVRCPSGSIVTVKSGDTEYTIGTDHTNKAIFTGLHHGTWDVMMQDGSGVITRTIDIVTDYETTIDFFSSIIYITYPAGSICTCSDGVITYTAPDITGYWECVVPNTGIWSVVCVDGNLTKSREVEITGDGEHVEVTLSYVTATIHVTYPEGAICTCSNDSEVYSADDTTGEWTFIVYGAGNWTIAVTDNIQTVTETVSVNYDGQVRNVNVKFFEAYITVTYPSGAKCTCTDGMTTYTAPDTSGSWTVVVPRTGIWMIKAVKNSSSVVQTVEITEDGQNESVTCEFFASYINVIYPSGTYKLILWYITSTGDKIEVVSDSSGSGSCRFIVSQTGEYEVGAYRVIPYVGIESNAGDYDSGRVTISSSDQTASLTLTYNTIPKFTYTGTYKIIDDDGNAITESNKNWNVAFCTTGNLRFTELNGANEGIDVFVLGGGGDGGRAASFEVNGTTYSSGGGGGGGGYRSTSFNEKVGTEHPYEIIVGGRGGSSSAFNVTASGGSAGGTASGVNNAGEGGTGGSDGGRGGINAGSGTNGVDGTYAFIGSSGTRYGPGGGGGYGYNGEISQSGPVNYGGSDGGGNSGENGKDNFGAGGGGANHLGYTSTDPGFGGSGIVIIRNKR